MVREFLLLVHDAEDFHFYFQIHESESGTTGIIYAVGQGVSERLGILVLVHRTKTQNNVHRTFGPGRSAGAP